MLIICFDVGLATLETTQPDLPPILLGMRQPAATWTAPTAFGIGSSMCCYVTSRGASSSRPWAWAAGCTPAPERGQDDERDWWAS